MYYSCRRSYYFSNKRRGLQAGLASIHEPCTVQLYGRALLLFFWDKPRLYRLGAYAAASTLSTY